MENEWLAYEWFEVKNVRELKDSLKLIPDDTGIESLELRLLTHLPTKKTVVQHRTKETY